MPLLLRFLRDNRGTTAIEYGIIAVAIALAIVTGASLIGSELRDRYYGPVANSLTLG
ncbi:MULTISPECIES: Flp family type IVb pilin [unclassified Beijerinckia]|uniref:Flp family type IVb pilin n=1 Tax=unclassified Beijerinckia TaxID=2638183 RepID=UPI000894789B|nr:MULTISPECIES: Flp family type IVb pilin [unclassified Beijerinckia]MDH7796681.1 pilus assembly protein Flp/PilA [Beijerinckia sp. GAS462]SEC55468.1 pilus assembly protein Flp/PilA [Beijerinckia sp. 28-YEA-48]